MQRLLKMNASIKPEDPCDASFECALGAYAHDKATLTIEAHAFQCFTAGPPAYQTLVLCVAMVLI